MRNKRWGKKIVCGVIACVMVLGLVPAGILGQAEGAEDSLQSALDEAKAYIDGITINSTANDPATVVKNFGTHFTWDNEKREDSKSYLFDWSYYNGVVFEGIQYVYDVTGEQAYFQYLQEYMSSLIAEDGTWATCTNDSSKQCAGYSSTHGADCYKTASMLLDMYKLTQDERYLTMAGTLYADLDEAAESYLLPDAGNNFRHTWSSDPSPDLWLDGLYMILPFRAEYAAYVEDQEELDLIVERMQWVSDNMYDETSGLFYHAADSAASNSGTYWLRSIGWYAAAIVDIMDSMEGENLETMKAQLVKLVDGMKACQNATNGMWLNNVVAAESETNPYETSGTALVCYAVMKAVNEGWLDESCADMAVLGFKGICDEKLVNNNLTDICFKGTPGSSNSTFYDNEGKGVGPFIMLYAEMLEYAANGAPDETPGEDEDTTPDQEYASRTDETTGITVSAPSMYFLTVEEVTDESILAIAAKRFTGNVLAYDITPAGYEEGQYAVVTFPIPLGMDADQFGVYYISPEGTTEYMPGILSDGGRSYTFVTTHFSVYVGGERFNGAAVDSTNNVTGTGNLPGSYTYTLDTNGVDDGSENRYLIVGQSNAVALYDKGSGNEAGVANVTISNNNTITLDHQNYDWYFDQRGNSIYITHDGTNRLYHQDYQIYTNSIKNQTWTIERRNSNDARDQGQYRLTGQENQNWRLYYSPQDGDFRVRTDNNTYVRLFILTSSNPGEAVTFSMSPKSISMLSGGKQSMTYEITLSNGTPVTNCEITWESSNTSVATVANGVVTAVASGSTTITATLSEIDGEELVKPIVLTVPVNVWGIPSESVDFSVLYESQKVTSLDMVVEGTRQLIPSVIWGEKVQETYGITWESSDESVATVSDNGLVTAKGEGAAIITATLNSIEGQSLSEPISYEINVTVSEKEISGVTLTPGNNAGTVYVDAESPVKTGAKLQITYTDGTHDTVDIIVGMLQNADGTSVSTATAGTYGGLKVVYGEKKAEGEFTLNVVDKPDQDYPDYPNPGSVFTNKYIDDYSQFQNKGVAEINLTAAGVPIHTGVDVILVTDLSNSMAWEAGGRTDATSHEASKVYDLQQAVGAFADSFLKDYEDGSPTKNTISLVTFGGYDADYTTEIHNSYADPTQTLLLGSNSNSMVKSVINNIRVLADDALSIGTSTTGYYLSFDGGKSYGENYGNTNYDHAFMQTYKAVEELKSNYANNNNGLDYDASERELYILFMTDGAPSNYNGVYFNRNQGNNRADTHCTWINASDDEVTYTMGNNGAQYQEGPWYQYIAGGPYNAATDTIHGNPLYWADQVAKIEGVKEIINIGFDLDNGGFSNMTFTQADGRPLSKVLEKLVSGKTLKVYSADNQSDLEAVYADLANTLKVAATNAYFVDQISEYFTLQMASTVTVTREGEKTVEPLVPRPQITISTRPIGDDGTQAIEQEVVVFSDDGTKAYSSAIDKDGDGIFGYTLNNGKYTFDDGDNIVDNGVIYGKYFWYNTNQTTTDITLADDSTYPLPANTFYWNIGTINNLEFVLSYYVFLKGLSDGSVAPGSYPTNSFATLYYDNWLGHKAQQSVDTPIVSWDSVSVYYGFYLVDEYGNPVTDRATGTTGDFANAVKVTPKMFYGSADLGNPDVEPLEILAKGLNKEYDLYDTSAEYKLFFNGDGSAATGWEITTGNGKVKTTYVTDYRGNEVTTDNYAALVDKKGIDLGSTTVWFAVVWKPSAISDTVVIDFGLPVDIDVLSNDLFGSAGILTGVGVETPLSGNKIYADNPSIDFPVSMKFKHGTASLNGGKIRYIPGTMTMNDPEIIWYEVRYETTINGVETHQYYYGQLTVIPATTVYYEDNFATLSVFNVTGYQWQDANGEVSNDLPGAPENPLPGDTYMVTENGQKVVYTYREISQKADDNDNWVSKPTTAIQQEDRPGFYSLSDANNIYGYDPAYNSCSTFSMDSAAKVTVDADTYATAEFTFTGTGFDIIALTSNATGVMVAQIYESDGNGGWSLWENDRIYVDTYFGYVFDEETGDWEVAQAPNPNALYQIPIITQTDMEYGRYKVVLTASYSKFVDNVAGSDSYDLYLDAIRIYDPTGVVASKTANDTERVVSNAYEADGELIPTYQELRDNIIDKGNFGVDDGAVFIDGIPKAESIEDYKLYGPNNELYLTSGQAVMYQLKTVPNYLHVGLSSVSDNVSVTITGYANNAITRTVTLALNTATDMYYDLTAFKGETILIQNSGTSGILSVTTLKLVSTPAVAANVFAVISEETYSGFMLALSARYDSTGTETDSDNTTNPGTDDPGTDNPGTDNPGTDNPGTDDPGTDDPGTDDPGTDDPGTDDPGDDTTDPGENTTEPNGNAGNTDTTDDDGADNSKTILVVGIVSAAALLIASIIVLLKKLLGGR